MKVQYSSQYSQLPNCEELSSFLQPTNTGSDQGSLEQLNAEIEVLKASIGSLLALMVEKGMMTFEEACEASGKHEWYLKYYYTGLKVIP